MREERSAGEKRELAQPPLDSNGLHWGARIFFLSQISSREKCNPLYRECPFFLMFIQDLSAVTPELLKGFRMKDEEKWIGRNVKICRS